MKNVVAVCLGVLVLVGAAVLGGCQVGNRTVRYIAPAVPLPEKTLLGYAVDIAYMKGHLRAGIANIKEHGELSDIHAHASHPTIEGYHKRVHPLLKKRNDEFALELKSVLTNMPRETEISSFENGLALLNDSLTTFVPPKKLENIGFRAQVISTILDKTADEYADGISPRGTVILAHEYQDAFGFFWESRELYRQIEAKIPAKNNREIAELMGKLEKTFKHVLPSGDFAPPAEVDELVNNIIVRLEN